MTNLKSAILTSEAPAAIGPYSQAVRSGDFLFTSGQVAFDPRTGSLVEGGIKAETRQVLQNLEAVLRAAGLAFSNVVKTTIFLADMEDFGIVNAIYGEVFSADDVPPARSTVQVAQLPRKALIEIEIVARFPKE